MHLPPPKPHQFGPWQKTKWAHHWGLNPSVHTPGGGVNWPFLPHQNGRLMRMEEVIHPLLSLSAEIS